MNQTLLIICKLIIELFLFSCIGWLIEVILKFLKYHRFINRGYLLGPYCPIYGCGVVTVTVFVNSVIDQNENNAEIFLIGLLICGVLEYSVSWYMEKMYHARWWDYSMKPMNLNGRIWIGNLLAFGVGSVVVIKWINPGLFSMLARWPDKVIVTVAFIFIFVLVIDNIVSGILMNIVKKEIDSRDEDNTEEVTKKVRELLRDKNLLIRRINEAYPYLQARPARLTAQLKAAKQELKAANKNIKEELKAAKKRKEDDKSSMQKVNARLQPGMKKRDERIAEAQERVEKAWKKLYETQEKFSFHKHW